MKKLEDRWSFYSPTLLELLIGIITFGLVTAGVGSCLVSQKVYYVLGLFLGIMMALLAAIHMAYTLDRSMYLGEAASKYAIGQNAVRYLFILCSFACICITDFASPLAAFLGIMGLKVGAYLQPFTHKCLRKLRRR